MGKNGIEALTKFVEANANEHIRNQLNLQEGKLANEQVIQGQLLPSLQAGPLHGPWPNLPHLQATQYPSLRWGH